MFSTYTAPMDKVPECHRASHGGNPRRLTLRMNFIWTLTGNVIYTACQWGILVVLAKLGTSQMVGEFALALAITAPIIIGTGLSLRSVQATDAASEYRFGDYLLLRLLTTAFAGLLIAGTVYFSRYPWHAAAVIMAVGLAKGVESVSEIFYGVLQQHERMDRIALSMIIKGLLSLGVVVGATYLFGDLLPGACSLAAVWTLILLFYDIPSGASVLYVSKEVGSIGRLSAGADLPRRLQLRWRPRALVMLTLLALPVGIVMALISFNANIPRYFIEHHLGTRELGIFAALAYPLAAGTTVIGALGQSATPRLARHYADGDYRAFVSLIRRLLGFGLVVGVAGVLLIWLAGQPLLTLLYRPEYSSHAETFLWLGIAAGIGYVGSLMGFGMTAARHLRSQLPIFLVATVVTAAGCAVLVPWHQLVGAAGAMILSAICQTAGSAAVIVRALRVPKVK